MGRLIGLELHNFKSYRGTAVIGFGSSAFTSIIGPNGAGKSNMMDAISFVLGVKSSHLRSQNLSDLIYRGRKETHANTSVDELTQDPTRAHVTAIYEKSSGEILNLKRTITSAGHSEYKINGDTVTALQYSTTLKTENILIKARNFLVFQGDVEQIASQSPKDLSKLIETISGSAELAKEYDSLKESVEKTHEEATAVFSRKRTLNSESKQYKEQLIEQETFEKKLTQRNQLLKIINLYRLYHSEAKHNALQSQLDEKAADLKLLKTTLASHEKDYKAIISKYAKHLLELKQLDNHIDDVAQKIESKKRELIPIQANKKSIAAKIYSCKSKINDIKQDMQKQQAEKRVIEKKLLEAKRQFRQFQAEIAKANSNLSLSEETIKEYQVLRDQFMSDGGSQLEEEIGLLYNEKDAISSTINNYNNQKNNALTRIAELESSISIEFKPKLTDVTVEMNDLLALKQEKTNERHSLVKEKERANARELEMNTQLRDILVKLDELASQQRESNKQKQLRQNLSMLKNSFKDGAIRGLVYELVRPTQQKYETALLTVLGRNFDSIVVETTSIAHKCIEILKESRSGIATFIPLDSVVNDAVNVNYLRNLDAQAKPAIDIVEYDDSSLEKAIKFVVGDTVVVDGIDVARKLKWNSQHSLENRLVTLDGSVIHASGLMTGGQQGNKSTAVLNWDKNEWKSLNEQKDTLTSALTKLNDEKPKEIEINMIVESINEIEEKLPLLREQVASIERKVDDRQNEIRFQQDLIKDLDKTISEKKTALSKVDQKLASTQAKVKVLQDKIYHDFSSRNGFNNGISDYEDLHGASLRGRAKEAAQFKKVIATLTNQVEFQQERIDEVTERQQKLEQDLELLTSSTHVFDDDINRIKEEIDVLEAEVDVSKTEKDTKSESLDKKLNASKAIEIMKQEVESEMSNINKSVSNIGEALLKVDSERVSVLKNCKIANIDVPLKDGFLESVSLNNDTEKLVKEVYSIELDYSLLTERLRANFSPRVEAEVQEEYNSVVSELEQLTPNLKAVERLKEVEKKLKSFDRDFTVSRQKEQKAIDAFNKVKDRRTELFKGAFDHISGEIDFIYKELTKSAASPLGGSAYLTLEDEDEPYTSGIKYHAMPPMKRFRDMELLSGGEKTVAALALLFAIHSFQPSPFFVLDEVDAALDNSNVNKVANYIKKYAGPDFQFIVISLKSTLFEKSDALVGIYREQRENSSKTLTLDLREYAEEAVV